jgi:uncharacterized protein YcbX
VISVTKLSIAAVKGTRLRRVEAVELVTTGARGDRRFFVIDDRDRMINAKGVGELHTVIAECGNGRLTLRFPGDDVVEGEIAHGEEVSPRFYSRALPGRIVDGPWATRLSEHVGRPVRLVEPAGGAVDRGRQGAISLISRGSLDRLAAEAGGRDVDSRRFRMLVEVDGVDAHTEDRWVGRRARVGAATVRFGGHVGRCLITSREPETGVIDLPTLDLLRAYRGGCDSTEPLPFGIYGEVLGPGIVRVGDRVELLD